MEQINYEPYLRGQQPPAALVEWTIKNGGLQQEYLIYKAGWKYEPLEDRNHRAVEVTCTKCGKTFIADRVEAGGCGHNYPPAKFGWWNPLLTENVISGYTTKCPCCRTDAKTIHIGNISHQIDNHSYVSQVVRLPIPGMQDRLVLLEWQISRYIGKEGRSSYGTWLWSAWVVEERKMVRLKGWQRYLSTLSYTDITQKKTFLDDYGSCELMYPFEESVLYGTTGENCKLDRYIQQGGETLVAYLAVWRKKPALENLIMQGCGRMVEELIHEGQYTYSYQRSKGIPALTDIDWKQKKPHLMLHISREEFRQYKQDLTAKDVHMIGKVTKAGLPLKLSQHLPLLRKSSEYEVERILAEQPTDLFYKILQYIGKPGNEYISLRDYWRMAAALDMDLDSEQVRWPKDLKAAHDYATKAYNKKKTKILKESFDKRRAELDTLSWHCDGILIRPCASQEEMKNEGKLLHHCVARYAEDHALGKTAIFFIRLESESDKPFFTLEWDEKNQRVVQNRGNHNCARTPEVEAFERKWLTWVANRNVKVGIEFRRKSA